MKEYTDYDKYKFVNGFKNCHLTIGEYCDKMNISVNDLKKWIKEYKELPKFGVIDVKEVLTNDIATADGKEDIAEDIVTTPNAPVKFETDKIKIELQAGYDKKILSSIMGVILNA